MAASYSWVAVRGAAKGAILKSLGLAETGAVVKPGRGAARISCAERPGGWTVVFSEDFAWADEKRVWQLSRFGFALGCQFRDQADAAAVACAATMRRELWRVSVEGQEPRQIRISGEPPATPAVACASLFERSGGQPWSITMLQIPVELAMFVCGYRADGGAAPLT